MKVFLRNESIPPYRATKRYSTGRINGKAIWVTKDETVGETFPFFAFAEGYPLAGGYCIFMCDATSEP